MERESPTILRGENLNGLAENHIEIKGIVVEKKVSKPEVGRRKYLMKQTEKRQKINEENI